MPDETSAERSRSWPPRGIAVSVLISMGAWMVFGSPGGEPRTPPEQTLDGWRVVPGQTAEEARCGYQGEWAVLEYVAGPPTRVGEDLFVQSGDRWEFEDDWEAANLQVAIVGDPLPGSPQEGMDAFDLADRLQSAPADWRHGGRTACVPVGEERQGPPR
ncbi:hypothetical protein [Streptomyces spiramenti]|uniref:Uncharacterized protein n=1 Tax=Streptomyces spiramenti TaxID=2720606 RepID=A0ABX1ACZ5_9ACTN|nr:hypothetical protein [Streptomyces spiramenti]NJP65077.1 hypothetical protein [Streptomyces spiramenti]